MKYVDTSALLRVLFCEPGASVPLTADERVVTSQLLEVEAFRAVDRARLLGQLDDAQTARKRKELIEMVTMLDRMPIDSWVIERAKSSLR
jgi:predicted nucleic acid-binding protein